ncbi:MAG TPA: carboxypeptidase-like regulatory domain-containing protein [Puia sp.]|nr:carboxypeptidase-like regulatory domain-containing protein [Puia sp.]
MNKIILTSIIIIPLLSSFRVSGQSTIRGKVVDQITNEPLESAVITNARSLKNTLTDKQGYFMLKNLIIEDSFSISFIGYRSKKIKMASDNANLTIQLEKAQIDLKEVVITNHSNNLATSRMLSSIDLNMLPLKSAQDLLRYVPGLFIAQHQGGGKAEQIFLRGFDADHGTDVHISVDGVPVNLVSQAHGQGYADLHFVIPETIAGYDFGKGPYYASKGDFCTAGYVAYKTIDVLDRNMIKIEAGEFSTTRAVTMINLLGGKAKQKGTSAYLAGDALYTNGGPFDVPQHFNRFNFLGKFTTKLGNNSMLNISLSSLISGWRAAGEIPNRALAEGYIKDRFGSIDTQQGGYTSRANANVRLTTKLRNDFTWENQAYYSHYYFDLISNFTFYYADPVNGDEFGQHEKRETYGYKSLVTHQNYFGNATLTSTAGVELRRDYTHPSWLAHTLHRDSILDFIQLGSVTQANLDGYVDETFETGKWLFNIGGRFDYFNFYYLSTAPASDTAALIYTARKRSQNKSIISPKINIQYTINPKTQLYLKMGKGFHSNDARVVIANEGYQILPSAYGTDIGINWKPTPRLFINAALWYLYLQQEFTYGSDYGDESVQPGGRTVRKGIDVSARYQISDWLFANANVDFARPREIDQPKGENYLPLAPTFTSTAGLFYKCKNGLNGGISYRYMHNRAANADYSLTAVGYFITDLTANYTKRKFEVSFAVENLFNQRWNESEFAYLSRLKNEIAPVDEVSYTPGLPFFARFKLAVFF